MINMVSTLDGKASVDGRSKEIGSRVDRRVMHKIRAQVDAVMIGAETFRAEKMTLDSDDSSLDLLKIIVSASGEVPIQENLLGATKDRTVVFTSPEGSSRNAHLSQSALVETVELGASSGLDLSLILKTLQERYSIKKLLVEGGPKLNYQLFTAGLVDELFITLAPKVAGGTAEDTTNILAGSVIPGSMDRHATLESIYTSGSEIFLRYSVHFR